MSVNGRYEVDIAINVMEFMPQHFHSIFLTQFIMLQFIFGDINYIKHQG